MADYKQKLAQMWKDESPTMEDLLDVVADFCDDLGSRPELYTVIYETSGKIFACVGMVTEVEYPMLAEVIVNQGERIKRMEAEIERLRATIRDAVEQINMLPVTFHAEIMMRMQCRDIVAAIIKDFYP